MPSKDGVFFEDGDENGEPVSHEGEEVLEDEKQVVATCDGADEVDDCRNSGPEVSRYSFPSAPQDLKVEGCGVGARDLVGAEAMATMTAQNLPNPPRLP